VGSEAVRIVYRGFSDVFDEESEYLLLPKFDLAMT